MSNAAGHWEPEHLVGCHERMLSALGSAWHDWAPLDIDGLPAEQRGHIASEVAGIIADEFGESALICLKDPRISRFARFFIEVVEAAGYDVVTLVALRNPLDVIESLIARDQDWPETHGRIDAELLWLSHMLSAERAVRDRPHAIVSYEALMEDPAATLDRAQERHGLPLPRADTAAADAMRAFLSPTLRHHDAGAEQVRRDPRTSRWVADAYDAFRDLENGRDVAAAHTELDRIAGEYGDALRRGLAAVRPDASAPDETGVTGPEADLMPATYAARTSFGVVLDVSPGPSPGNLGAARNLSAPVQGGEGIWSDFEFEPLESGWYRIVAEIQAEATIRPRIYVAQGRSFARDRSAALARIAGTDLYEGRFLARLPFDSVRLEAASGIAPVRWTSATIGRLGLRQRFSGLIASSLRKAAWRPTSFVSMWKAYPRLKRSRDFIDLSRFWPDGEKSGAYDAWIERYDYDDDFDRARLAARVAALPSRPRISVVMPVYDTQPELLDEAIRSVVDQVYPDWELCIANDGSRAPHVRPQLDRWAARDQRIKVVHQTENGHISHATNAAFALAAGEWVALLDHDDLFAPNALAEVVLALDAHPDAALVYSDEDKVDEKGRRFDPHFKPDYSPELLRSMNYFNHLTVHRADLVRAVGGWRPGFEGSQDYDIALRILERVAPAQVVHVPKVLYHWRAIAGSTALSGTEKSYASKAGLRALVEHLARTGQDARAVEVAAQGCFRVQHTIRQPEPLVSLIIPTRDRVDLLRVAVESILQKTTYRNFEIIVMDNDSQQAETFAFFDEIKRHANVRVIAYPHPFNYSAINNEAVRHARGAIIGLINNDIEVITPDWLGEMVSWAQLERVGCVGAMLYYPNDTIQHAGVIVGLGGVAGHSHKHWRRGESGYFSRAKVVQNLSAVTGACLLVRRVIFDEVGGLDEIRFKVAFNDVDFCLRVRAAGYENVWTPFAELYHHESPSRGADVTPEKRARFDREIRAMKELWGPELAADPYYSPNLTTHAEDFSIAK
ncbi:glycosyltransferase [Aquibium carbonis]|nr:glycosyltransferase [Aquibium carbonis]